MTANGPNHANLPDALPVLPLKEMVVYPSMRAPILVGQPRSIELAHASQAADGLIALVTQRSTGPRPARPEDLYRVGTVAAIHGITPADDGTVRLTTQGIERVRLVDFVDTEPHLVALVQRAPETEERTIEREALQRTARELFIKLVGLAPELPNELDGAAQATVEPRQLAYLIAARAPIPLAARQEILELDSVAAKFRRLIELLRHELSVRHVMRQISAERLDDLTQSERTRALRRQLETIQRELREDGEEEVSALRAELERHPLPYEARKEVDRELDRLERTPEAAPEHAVLRSWLEWVGKLPWGRATAGAIDLARARAVLDEDHFDLDAIKDRIVDYLAVRKLRLERQDGAAPLTSAASGHDEGRARGEPILCLLGPPGVGKTSLGYSIARAMGRRFARISLGGVHDEAEIRGHRRAYIGAAPGRVLSAIARVEAIDPVVMLDEIDKLGTGVQGDPAAALLEVLDPAQNHAFVDTYLGVPFDLSRVLFLCTANTTETIPPALLDRMEVLALSGYTDAEKLRIVRRHLWPRELAAHGLREGEVVIDGEALVRVVREYTREAGVRGLSREISAILRKAARRIGEGAAAPIQVQAADVPNYLGPPRFYDEVAERIDRPGIATGLAWTPAGGEILFVEATMMPADEERLVLTGMLGNVMRESAQAALSYLRSNAEPLGLDPRAFVQQLVHVHVPAGAIPKDGPSAGLPIVAALVSQATGRPVRNDLAMTGEITLRGKVLPVGGIKEKVLAAHRAGIRTVILPRRSERALDDVPDEVREALGIVLVESIDEALAAALAPVDESVEMPTAKVFRAA